MTGKNIQDRDKKHMAPEGGPDVDVEVGSVPNLPSPQGAVGRSLDIVTRMRMKYSETNPHPGPGPW